ncbi:hypothetical protein TNIN_75781 [Trichonephila inaurata madagascariensis]|uniref:Uncharacterized protein n=1 Tax=Trichonephila inaurata madagascariensis TaxID=2747483 RepID=A0A8X7C2Y1_9ARAC|nr:hypothetical protein TNIN_75781 [Trichonephila inaurata madagascariensis]
MDLSLPPSARNSRPGTLRLSTCQQLRGLAYRIKETILISYQKLSECPPTQWNSDDESLSLQLQILETSKQDIKNVVSGSPLYPLVIPPAVQNITAHITPYQKNLMQDFPPLPKTNSIKGEK